MHQVCTDDALRMPGSCPYAVQRTDSTHRLVARSTRFSLDSCQEILAKVGRKSPTRRLRRLVEEAPLEMCSDLVPDFISELNYTVSCAGLTPQILASS